MCHHAETATNSATPDQAALAMGRAFAHSEHHRCPQFKHTNCSTVRPVGTSIAVSTRRAPSQVLHRLSSVSIDQMYGESKPMYVQNCTYESTARGPYHRTLL